MGESVGSGFGRGIAPYVVVGAIVVAVWHYRHKIAGWIKSKIPGAGIPDAVRTGVNNLSQWPAAIVDWVTPDPVIPGTPLPEGFGDPNQNIQGQFDWKVIPGGFGTAAVSLAPAPPVVSDPSLPVVGASVPELSSTELIVQQFAQKTGTTEQIAGAYLASRYGLSFEQFMTLARQEPTFAAKVGLPGETYESLYLPNTPSGVYVGPNLNPLVPQGDSAYTTIYNPASGAMWSGSAASTSYLMGSSPEAAAWRERYL